MAYLTAIEYQELKGVVAIPSAQLPDLLELASVVIDSLVQSPITEVNEDVKLATAHQASSMYLQGGISSVSGFSSENFSSESLGDYSYSKPSGGSSSGTSSIPMSNGIPLSPLSIHFLRRAGLLHRLAGAYREEC